MKNQTSTWLAHLFSCVFCVCWQWFSRCRAHRGCVLENGDGFCTLWLHAQPVGDSACCHLVLYAIIWVIIFEGGRFVGRSRFMNLAFLFNRWEQTSIFKTSQLPVYAVFWFFWFFAIQMSNLSFYIQTLTANSSLNFQDKKWSNCHFDQRDGIYRITESLAIFA